MSRYESLDDGALAWTIHQVRSSLCVPGFVEDRQRLRERLSELLVERERRAQRVTPVRVAGEVWHVSTNFATVTDD